jgi:hypothetical protein
MLTAPARTLVTDFESALLPLALEDGLEKRGVLSIGYPQCCGERLPRFSRGTYKIINQGNPPPNPLIFFKSSISS